MARMLIVAASACGSAGASAGDRELGEYLSSECVTCHQLSGKFSGIPVIVGLPEHTLIQALTEYRARIRDNAVMRAIAVKFTDEEIAALATYFNSLTPETQ